MQPWWCMMYSGSILIWDIQKDSSHFCYKICYVCPGFETYKVSHTLCRSFEVFAIFPVMLCFVIRVVHFFIHCIYMNVPFVFMLRHKCFWCLLKAIVYMDACTWHVLLWGRTPYFRKSVSKKNCNMDSSHICMDSSETLVILIHLCIHL